MSGVVSPQQRRSMIKIKAFYNMNVYILFIEKVGYHPEARKHIESVAIFLFIFSDVNVYSMKTMDFPSTKLITISFTR